MIITSVLLAMVVYNCSEAPKDAADELLNNSSWSKAVNEYPFLANFPEVKFDFRGSYQELYNGESYIISAWNMEAEVADAYKNELKNAGFLPDEEALAFSKTIDSKLYSASISYGAGMIAITYTVKDVN